MSMNLFNYTYGTTRLGDERIPFQDRVSIARSAMDAGIWFHTSHTYGNALQVLRAAKDQGGTMPPAIFKIGWDSVEQVREVIHQNLEPLGESRMAIGQLCLGGSLSEEFRMGGACYEGLSKIKEEGLVDRFVLEVWPWNSHIPLEALQERRALELIDGLIFYLNPLQRFVSNELWDFITEQQVPIIAMRTVCGGNVQAIRDSGEASEVLQKRAAQVGPLFERSGCESWTQFCVRYVYGFSEVQTTVGATSRMDNLSEFIQATQDPEPLPADIHKDLVALQRRWADEHDRFAEPWSM